MKEKTRIIMICILLIHSIGCVGSAISTSDNKLSLASSKLSKLPSKPLDQENPPKEIIKAPITAKLEMHPEKKNWLVLTIENSSKKAVRFVDIPEGSHDCGEFYQVIKTSGNGEKHESNAKGCLYAPLGKPELVELQPGEKYSRDIQPGAYFKFEHERNMKPPYIITVVYRLTEEGKNLANTLKLDMTFQTEPLMIKK